MLATQKILKAFTAGNKVQLIRGGKDYFDLLVELISKAEQTIHLQTYIFDSDETGSLVADALKSAVKRGVKVFVIADGYASQGMSKAFIKELDEAGIRFRFFEPVFRSRNFYFGRRLHHKVTVIDSKYSLVGGINISNRYNDINGSNAWLDFALYAKGEISKQLCLVCKRLWKGYQDIAELPPCEVVNTFSFPANEQSEVRMRRNDWVRRRNEISTTYLDMLRNSEKQVTILCSYFLPGKLIRRQIIKALKRGVNVRVIAAGPSDVMLAKNAERWLYDWLLRNGVELYEYEKNVLHGKMAVCDDKLMTIGSYNINDISAYASIELNLDVQDAVFAKKVRETLDTIIHNDCIRITFENHVKAKNIFRQFVRWCSYQFIRVVFNLFTFYFKQN